MRNRFISMLGTILRWGVTFFIAGYFIFHALGIGGGYGYFSLDRLDGEIAHAEEELTGLTQKRSWLEHRVGLISGEYIDADLLGELARKQGGLYAYDEIILFDDGGGLDDGGEIGNSDDSRGGAKPRPREITGDIIGDLANGITAGE